MVFGDVFWLGIVIEDVFCLLNNLIDLISG